VELFQSACGDIQRTIAEIKTLKESKGKNAVNIIIFLSLVVKMSPQYFLKDSLDSCIEI
jgi:hypothetical protein